MEKQIYTCRNKILHGPNHFRGKYDNKLGLSLLGLAVPVKKRFKQKSIRNFLKRMEKRI
jgi:hypothetical protein